MVKGVALREARRLERSPAESLAQQLLRLRRLMGQLPCIEGFLRRDPDHLLWDELEEATELLTVVPQRHHNRLKPLHKKVPSRVHLSLQQSVHSLAQSSQLTVLCLTHGLHRVSWQHHSQKITNHNWRQRLVRVASGDLPELLLHRLQS